MAGMADTECSTTTDNRFIIRYKRRPGDENRRAFFFGPPYARKELLRTNLN